MSYCQCCLKISRAGNSSYQSRSTVAPSFNPKKSRKTRPGLLFLGILPNQRIGDTRLLFFFTLPPGIGISLKLRRCAVHNLYRSTQRGADRFTARRHGPQKTFGYSVLHFRTSCAIDAYRPYRPILRALSIPHSPVHFILSDDPH
jgi:hypothetical protein